MTELLLSWIIPEQYEVISLIIAYILGFVTARNIRLDFKKLLGLMFILLFLWKVFNWQPTGITFEFMAWVSFFFVTWIQAEKIWEYINIYLKIKWVKK